MNSQSAGIMLLAVFFIAAGCRNAYYATWETFGRHKRDLLKSNVREVRQDQEEASEQFKDALTRLKELYAFEGGSLEKKYRQFQNDYEIAADKAQTVRKRINRVEQIASDLFSEWESEIQEISNANLRAASRSKLRETQDRFKSLHSALKQAEISMEPVLAQFRDQVLFLKHNLNAQAISALRGEALDVEKEIAELLESLNASIAEAERFIETMP